MAKEAIKNAAKLIGIILAKPPNFSKLVVPVLFSTAPPDKNKQDLYIALLSI